LKVSLGSYSWSTSTAPSPANGGTLKRHWRRFGNYRWRILPPVVVRLPDGTLPSIAPVPFHFIEEILQSWAALSTIS
jgi:hypothetical protein